MISVILNFLPNTAQYAGMLYSWLNSSQHRCQKLYEVINLVSHIYYDDNNLIAINKD